MSIRFAVNDPFDQPLLWQDIHHDSKPHIIQQQKQRALIYVAAATRNLDLLTLTAFRDDVAPRTAVLIRTDKPRAWIDIEFLRYPGVGRQKSPTSGKIDEPAVANFNINRDEITDVLVNVLADGVNTDSVRKVVQLIVSMPEYQLC